MTTRRPAAKSLATSKRVVVKIGSALLVDDESGDIRRKWLEALCDDKGRPMGTRAYKPQNIYARVNGVPPDLVVIFGDLSWRSVGTIGNPSLHVFDNDTGPDDANHAQQGMWAEFTME